MDNVTPLKPKKSSKLKRTQVTVCFGTMGMMEKVAHVAIASRGTNGCTIESESGLLIVDEGDDQLICYPIGGVFWWSERPINEAD